MYTYRYSYKQTPTSTFALIRPVAMCAYFTEIVITLAQLSGGGKSVSAFTHVCPGILSKRSTVATIFFLTFFSVILDANTWKTGGRKH